MDYIAKFANTGELPDFSNYFYSPEKATFEKGSIAVMPAGLRDATYGSKLATIDWQKLYGEQEGYFLLETLKQQWKEKLSPDYVLIDSRTGHTEVGGICTRQLPDTVVTLFIPNEQNLEGLESVVGAIRDENEHRPKPINIELVASNVPSLDDEHEILGKMMRKFSKRLGVRRRPPSVRQISTINRYDSMHLLNQSIFVLDRPRSRLAKQYKSLLRKVVDHNLDDREAALRRLNQQFHRSAFGDQHIVHDFGSYVSRDAEVIVNEIIARHQNDSEISFSAGQLYRGRGDLDEAEFYLERAVKLAKTQDDLKLVKYELELIECQHVIRGEGDFGSRLFNLLERDLESEEVQQVLNLLVKTKSKSIGDVMQFPALLKLENHELDSIAWQLSSAREWQSVTLDIYEQIVKTKRPDSMLQNLMLSAIGCKRFNLVIDHWPKDHIISEAGIGVCFNYAMADWGRDGRPDQSLFERVVELDSDAALADVNYNQCLAVSLAVVGKLDEARERLNIARTQTEDYAPQAFSCWRYLRVNKEDFLEDLDLIQRLIEGEDVIPSFMN